MADGRLDMQTMETPVLSRRSLRAFALGLAAFLGLALAISAWHRATTEIPEIAVMSEKLADYRAMANKPDVVFLGSSQTFRHVDPAIIDAGLRQCGLDLTSYNFGVPALRAPEMALVTEEILSADQTPRLVVVQNPIRAETVFSNMMSARGRHFRGGGHLGAALEDVQCYTGTRKGQARSLFNNLRAMLAEGFGLGRLAQSFIPTKPAPPPAYNPAYRSQAGFHPVERDGNDHVLARLDNTPMTPGILARGRAGEGFAPPEAAASCRARQLTGTLDRFRAAGVGTAFFVSPAPLDVAHDRPVTAAMAAQNPGMPILDFNDADAAERYFQPEYWFDQAHMNGAGAARLSGDIARRLCAILQDSGG